jgi:hypothetical protein
MVPSREAGQKVDRLTTTKAIIAESVLSCIGAYSGKLGDFLHIRVASRLGLTCRSLVTSKSTIERSEKIAQRDLHVNYMRFRPKRQCDK